MIGAVPGGEGCALGARATAEQLLDAAGIRSWCSTGLAALTAVRGDIDAVNVYPVPDADTGTNLVLTMQAVVESLAVAAAGPRTRGADTGDPDLADTVRAMARGALRGAQGNSGLILSQLLRGIAEVLADRDRCGGVELREALAHAAELAYAAVDNPVEGTVLTVARAAARAAAAIDSDELPTVAGAAAAGAAAALARTTDQLAVLAAADVVDAGGWGLVILLDALGQVVGAGADPAAQIHPTPPSRSVRPVLLDTGGCNSDQSGFGYEVQYLLAADEAAVRRLTARLRMIGDSVTIAGAGRRWNVHVHVDDVGAAVEAGIEAGRPHGVQVTRFDEQREETGHERIRAGGRRLFVVGADPGLDDLVEDAGGLVLPGTAGAGPAGSGVGPESAESKLAATVLAGGGNEVVLLPTGTETAAVATTAAADLRQRGIAVAVVPSRSAMQALAALAVAQPTQAFQDEVIAMTAAAGATRWGEVQRAPGRYQTSAGVCEPGDVLGLIEDDVVLIGTDVETTAAELLERLLTGGGELVTVVTGSDAAADLGERLAATAAMRWPAAEVVVYAARQLDRPVLLGIE